MIRGFFVCFLMGLILPVKLDNNDSVINNNLIQIPIARTKEQNNIHKPKKLVRIDIENYEEPTETPDLDNYDYTKEREDFWSSKENSKNIYRDNYDRDRDKDDHTYDRYDRFSNRDIENINGINRADEDALEDHHTADFYDSVINYADDRIVGGTKVDISLYPYHVGYGDGCSGAIIDKNWVITAAHCPYEPYIRVGSKCLDQGTKINIKRSIMHPNYLGKSKQHPDDFDFKLLETAETIKFNDNTQPIKLATIDDMVIGNIITVTGWGDTEENGTHPCVLHAVRLPIISKENCQNVPSPYYHGILTARMFCAGFYDGKKDACQGDSGGPAVANDRLLGIVSFGIGCAKPGFYGVYSKLPVVSPWIEQVTGLELD